ncbi:MAG: hypothetical protein JXB24_12005, partial [Bacteroidales bacterium]|nr:hypothetical protein [Bacteroidales bacterium]
MNNELFLATTALEEFWNKNQKIIFLGEWCKLYSRKNEWISLNYEDVPFVWKDTDITANGIGYCDEIYEKFLIELTHTLNIYHGIEKDVHYYRIILGNWLFLFIQQLYDKYLTLKKTFEKYPDAQTWLLDEEQYYIPVEYNDYVHHLCADRYALQLYSHIMTTMGYAFERKKLSKPIEQLLHYQLNFDLSNRSRFFGTFSRISSLISTFLHEKTITITAPYFSYNIMEKSLKILFKSRFRCIFDDMRYKINISFKIDQKIRKQKLSLNDDEFESVLSKILLSNMPILFMEGFASFRNAVENLPIHKSRAFYTANALHGDYIFKFYVAEQYKTIKILDGQHGGGYGVDFINTIEEYEKSVTDIFYTSGWKKNECTKPLAVPKFHLNKSSNNFLSDKILFTINEMPRYVYRLHFLPLASNNLFETIEQIMVFLKHFQKRDKLLIRSYPQGIFGWDTEERIANEFNDCSFDDFSKPFDQMLNNTRIFLTSGPHTT